MYFGFQKTWKLFKLLSFSSKSCWNFLWKMNNSGKKKEPFLSKIQFSIDKRFWRKNFNKLYQVVLHCSQYTPEAVLDWKAFY